MNDENSNLTLAGGDTGRETTTQDRPSGPSRRRRSWLNWILALLTVPAAAVALVFQFGALMSTDACSDRQCASVGPGWVSFDVLSWGAPAVAVVAILVSFFTARRRWGIVVPLCALALLGADIVILAVTVLQ